MENKVAIQGIAGSFHEEAALHWFGPDVDLLPCSSFDDLFAAMKNGTASHAMMAVENTLAGTLLPNLALLQDANVNVVGEHYLRIGLHLMGLPTAQLTDLKSVFSHPIALRQCTPYLRKHNLAMTDFEDTAAAAEMVKTEQNPALAAVAGYRAAEHYGMEILARNIETNQQNYTRFLALSAVPFPVEQPNKATISFQLPHQSGSLAHCLTIFANHQLNLTKIQSVPIIGQPQEYCFHVDVVWNDMEDWENAKKTLPQHTEALRIYGEYRSGHLPVNTQPS